MKVFQKLKSYKLSTLLLLVAVAALLANFYRLQTDLKSTRYELGSANRKVALLQVQLMNQIISPQLKQTSGKILENPEEWLAPLQEKINADPKLASMLQELGFQKGDSVEICCNPVNGDPDPYECFTLTFSANKCVRITRKALCPW